jgi:hypothetical protein
MKKKNFNRKGQFSIIAALLVAVVLVTVLMTTYSLVRNSPFETSPQTLDAVNEIDLALKNLLTYTIGYYGSILQVSGNRTYAQGLTSNYLSGGLASIANEYAQWSPSFTYSSSNTRVNWFGPTSYSYGNLSVTYSLSGLGLNNINYSTSSELDAVFNSASATQTRITVTEEGGQPVITLTPQDFSFYSYSNVSSVWTTVYPSSASAFGNGTYVVSIPSGVDYNAFVVQITDSRSIMVTVSRLSYYTYALAWNSLYSSSLKNDVIVVEALQNGSLRWLGQNLKLTTKGRPIPPIPVKGFQINETINNVNRQVPFQVESWASQYTVPLGIASNASIFSNQNMLVFEINYNVTSVRISWNGADTVSQTSYAITDRYFKQDNTKNGVLTNGMLTLTISGQPDFAISSTISGGSTVSATFMRVNHQASTYGSNQSYVIVNGIIRDIVEQEAEWSGGITNCPDLYSQLVVTLPANATYYTYAVRTIFVNSSQAPVNRVLSDLSVVQLSIPYSGTWKVLTENGTRSNGYPNTYNITSTGTTGLFRNFTATGGSWAHHWSEYIQSSIGGGVMFTNASNFNLYAFDKIAKARTGALNVTENTQSQKVVIEVDPVTSTGGSASFTYPLDLTWYGAVVNFSATTTPIYPTTGSPTLGLWVIVEDPPTVSIS